MTTDTAHAAEMALDSEGLAVYDHSSDAVPFRQPIGFVPACGCGICHQMPCACSEWMGAELAREEEAGDEALF